MKNFDAIFNYMFLAIFIYQVFYFLVQFFVLKRIELLYYSLFLLCVAIYFYVFATAKLVTANEYPGIRPQFTGFQMCFAFLQSFFYLIFIVAYLGLNNNHNPAYKIIIFYKKFCVFFFIFFLLLGIFNINSQFFFDIISGLMLPIIIGTLILLWRLDVAYKNIVIWGTTCTGIGTSASYVLIFCQAHSLINLGINVNIPAQIGYTFDLFILGYGLAQKAAESDKKLIASLQENQKLLEVERSRLARDLHDGLGGLLSGVKLTLSSISGITILPDKNAGIFASAINQLDNTIAEMRRVAHSMMPEALLKFGLNEAVQDFCDGINETNAIKMKYQQINFKEPLEKPTEVILYRIIQELSNNSIKHAAASIIFIQLNQHERGISLVVEDDGKGFDTTQTKKGDGLQNVQSRIDYLKGNWDIKSEIGNGTSVNIEIPL